MRESELWVLCVPGFPSVDNEQQSQEKEVDSDKKDEMLLNVIRPDYQRPPPPPPMKPLYHLTDDGKVQGKHYK